MKLTRLKVNDIVITKKNRNVYYIIKDFTINKEGNIKLEFYLVNNLTCCMNIISNTFDS